MFVIARVRNSKSYFQSNLFCGESKFVRNSGVSARQVLTVLPVCLLVFVRKVFISRHFTNFTLNFSYFRLQAKIRSTVPPFLQLAAAQRIPSSSFYQKESQAQTLADTKPSRRKLLELNVKTQSRIYTQ